MNRQVFDIVEKVFKRHNFITQTRHLNNGYSCVEIWQNGEWKAVYSPGGGLIKTWRKDPYLSEVNKEINELNPDEHVWGLETVEFDIVQEKINRTWVTSIVYWFYEKFIVPNRTSVIAYKRTYFESPIDLLTARTRSQGKWPVTSDELVNRWK